MTLAIPGLHRGFLAVLVRQNPCLGVGHQLFDCAHDVVNHAFRQRLGRRHLFAFQQVGQSLLQAQQIDHAHHAATAGQQAEADFRQAQLHCLIVPGHAIIAAQADFETAAQRRTIDRRGYRHRQFFQSAQYTFGALQHVHKPGLVALLDFEQFFQVTTGEEHFFGRGEYHPGQALFPLQLFNGLGHGRAVLFVHRVHRTTHVHGHCHDAVCVFLVVEYTHSSFNLN